MVGAVVVCFACPAEWGVAGGINPDNVAEAIAVTGAPLVDVSSGVESEPGTKDPARIAALAKALRSGGGNG